MSIVRLSCGCGAALECNNTNLSIIHDFQRIHATCNIHALEYNYHVLLDAVKEIHNKQGLVCDEYEICEHPSCHSSFDSWAICDRVLKQIKKIS